MREENGVFVFDKKKAPMYGLLTLGLILGPLMYFLAQPELKNTDISLGSKEEEKQAAAKVQIKKPGEVSAEASAGEATGKPGAKKATDPLANIPTASAGAIQSAREGAAEGATPTPASKTEATPAEALKDFGKKAAEKGNGAAANAGLLAQRLATKPEQPTAPPVSASDTSSPAPVASPPRQAPEPNVWEPVRQTSSERFGNSIPMSAPAPEPEPTAWSPPPPPPAPVTPPAPPAPVTPPAPQPVAAPAPTMTAFSTPAPQARPAQPVQMARAVQPPAPARVAPPKPTPKPAAVAKPKAAKTTAVNAFSSVPKNQQGEGQAFGSSIPIQQATPTAAFGSSVPIQQSAPDRPVTSGLIYEREKPPTPPVAENNGTPAQTPVASTPSAGTPDTAMLAAASGQFGGGSAIPAPPAAAGNTLPAETPFGSTATTEASKIGETGPFKPLQQVPGHLITAINTLTGGTVPVVVVTRDGGSFVGVGTINGQLARVDMVFRRYIDAKGKVYAVDALAYSVEGANLTQGVAASIEPVAPTLAIDAAQNGVSALQEALMAALNAKGQSGTKIAVGDGATISSDALPPLWQILAGGVGSTFTMPKNTQSISRVAKVRSNTTMTVIVGLGGEM
ncbi:hypothetical protein [Deinococcus hopiensis]|nr:hypothetical protein [Deinococcus hopiensis]